MPQIFKEIKNGRQHISQIELFSNNQCTIEKIDLASWCFTLPESEYQYASAAHNACGATTTPDGRRMSINVEILGGSLMVQHYIEEIGHPDDLRLVSDSDLFAPTGRTKVGVIWDLSVKKIDDKTCEFTNTVHSSFTPELLDFLGKQGISHDVFQAARRPISEAQNRQETPGFAKKYRTSRLEANVTSTAHWWTQSAI